MSLFSMRWHIPIYLFMLYARPIGPELIRDLKEIASTPYRKPLI